MVRKILFALFFFSLCWVFFLPRKILASFYISSVSGSTVSNADDTVTVFATYSGSVSSKQYLQAAWQKNGGNYFGQTQNNRGEWVKYQSVTGSDFSSYSQYFFDFQAADNIWSGELKIKLDTESTNFKGEGKYLLKLFRYITAGGNSSDNSIEMTVNVASISANPVIESTSQVASTEIKISLDGKKFLDERFTVKIDAKNLAKETEFYVKIRGGLEESKLAKARTQNGSSWLSDGESWISFPKIKTNTDDNWSGEVYGMIDGEKDPGNYKFRVRFRNVSTESNYDSEIKEIEIIKPSVTAIPTSISIPTPTPKPTIIATKSAEVMTGLNPASQSSTLSGEVLGTKSGELKQNPPFVAAGLILFGLSLILGSVVKYRHGIKISRSNP